MTVRHAQDVEAKNVAAGKDTTIQVLIPSHEGPNFALRKNLRCNRAEVCRAIRTRWSMSNMC